jgi:hypothetical protein
VPWPDSSQDYQRQITFYGVLKKLCVWYSTSHHRQHEACVWKTHTDSWRNNA